MKLTSTSRNALPDSAFALPEERKYPIKKASGAPDKKHAANAKARATGQEEKGKISHSTEERIKAAANKVLRMTRRS